LTFERAEDVPYREYPAVARPVLGSRYCTVCGIDDQPLPFLLWSDEPFTGDVVTRELTRLGFAVVGLHRTRDPHSPWAARVAGDPEQPAQAYVGRFHGDCGTVEWVGLWSRRSGHVVHDQPGHGWRADPAAELLCDRRDDDTMVMLTEQQATGLAILAGHRLPTAAELADLLRAEEDSHWSGQQRWQRFYDHRAALFAADAQRVRAEGARLAGAPPPRRQVSRQEDRRRLVARIPALAVRVGEPFPLVRFLVGDFQDRPADGGYGSCTALCNRLDVVTGSGERVRLTLEMRVRGGLLVHPGVVTPYCPAEAGYLDDPELVAAQSGQRWPDPLWCAVLPVSPARFELWGRPRAGSMAGSPALRRLSIAVAFPGSGEFVAVPAWSDTFHLWDYFTDAGSPLADGEEGHEIFVPDDVNLMKAVQARIVEW
jgi:hypothetical protein